MKVITMPIEVSAALIECGEDRTLVLQDGLVSPEVADLLQRLLRHVSAPEDELGREAHPDVDLG